MLSKWRAQKDEQKKNAKETAKPLFKVCSVHNRFFSPAPTRTLIPLPPLKTNKSKETLRGTEKRLPLRTITNKQKENCLNKKVRQSSLIITIALICNNKLFLLNYRLAIRKKVIFPQLLSHLWITSSPSQKVSGRHNKSTERNQSQRSRSQNTCRRCSKDRGFRIIKHPFQKRMNRSGQKAVKFLHLFYNVEVYLLFSAQHLVHNTR